MENEYKKYFFCAFLFVLGNFEECTSEDILGDEQNPASVDNSYPYFDNLVYAMHEVIDNGFWLNLSWCWTLFYCLTNIKIRVLIVKV